MEEMLVVMGVIAVVAWWMHTDSTTPPQPEKTAAVETLPATPAPASPVPAKPN